MTGAIQHDDPTANGEAASWDQGDPESSGCYCEHCMAGFTKALEGLNESTRERLNVSAAFNYREVLLDNSSYAPAVLAELRELFVAFQVNSTERYIGKRNRHSFHFPNEKRSFCQDRLGTNIATTQKKHRSCRRPALPRGRGSEPERSRPADLLVQQRRWEVGIALPPLRLRVG